MKKTFLIIILAIILLVVAIRLFVPFPTSGVVLDYGVGKLIKGTDDAGAFIGIRQDFQWRRPFEHRYLRPTNLTTEYKVGDRVSYSYYMSDVVGIGKWVVFISLEKVKKL